MVLTWARDLALVHISLIRTMPAMNTLANLTSYFKVRHFTQIYPDPRPWFVTDILSCRNLIS